MKTEVTLTILYRETKVNLSSRLRVSEYIHDLEGEMNLVRTKSGT